MPKITPLAVRLARLDQDKRPANQIQTVLNFCSEGTRSRLNKASDEEIYSLFAGHYPKEEFYRKLVFTSTAPTDENPPGVISEELRRVLAIMDTEDDLVNNVDLLGALDVVMPKAARDAIRRCPDEMLQIICNCRLAEFTAAEGDLHGFRVSITVPAELDSFLEIVFGHIEECG